MDRRYAFANAVFDARRGVLTVGGRDATIRPRAAAVLQHLLDRPRVLVTKDDLLRAVWADIVVTENSLSQCVMELRRELGDAEERLVRTMPRRGYVLEADVKVVSSEAAPPRRTGPDRIAILVLPLVNIGGDPGQDYFAEGLTEDLTTDLGKAQGAFVIGRGTAQSYAGKAVDIRELGRELGVRYVVEGSVRREEGDIHVSLAVSESAQARQVWAERFRGRREKLLALQASMARRVAAMLAMELANVESDEIERSQREMDAHDMVLRAWSLWYRAAPDLAPESFDLVARALELDPRSARAWAMRAQGNVLRLATRSFDDWGATVADAEHAARKALAIDPRDRIAYGALGAALTFQGRLEEALAALDRQMDINPNLSLAQQWRGIVHILMGDAHLAIAPLEAAIELSPRDPRLSTFIRNLALAYLHLGEDARALAIAERSIHLPKPWPRSFETLAMAYAVNGLMEEARGAIRALLGHWPGYTLATHRAEMMSTRPAFLAQRERLLDALREAGLPNA